MNKILHYTNLLEFTGPEAIQLAELFGLPHKGNPKFVFENDGEDRYIGYDSNLGYEEDGHTYEIEWKLTR
jgi:hypothetical protein